MYSGFYVSDMTLNGIILDCNTYGTNDYGGVDRTCFVLVKEADIETSVGPLTFTKWNQTFGLDPSKPLGCVPVAVGQIMRFWEYPDTIRWYNMPLTNPTNTLSKFLTQIGQECGIDYNTNITNATVVDAKRVLRKYGYKHADYKNHNMNDVLKDLNLQRPVIMAGTSTENSNVGHAWICDGYKGNLDRYEIVLKILRSNKTFETINYAVTSDKSATYMFSMKWGWKQKDIDGYFSDGYNEYHLEGYDFNYNASRKDVLNIYH